ncbi:MFS general substrate transporter [Zopfia rhizophila CBS 207.26]|uniref:MFS general substrate transporter n=1 Tax=Zopfia rhizophila CBS 207.26 TaxID=1314779 RepID=A0A6A6DCE8_9PEZI|nr:MFS general substrate transporter [Zopfia rhizophila CBS 207.26]
MASAEHPCQDPLNPKNWPRGRKWRPLTAVSGFVLMSPLSTTIVAPSLDVIARELNITDTAQKPLVLSIFLLGFGIGPLFISPLSEIFGRTRVLQLFNAMYLAFNTSCGFAQTKDQLIVLRFLSGLFGSASVGRWYCTIGDMFNASERGKAIAVYSVAPLIGPTIGPIAELEGVTNLYTEYKLSSKREVIRINMIRLLKLLVTHPVVQVLPLYQGHLYGNIYITYAYFPTLWTVRYHQQVSIASLNYLSLGIGTVFAAEITTHMNDQIYKFLIARDNDEDRPEFRAPIMVPATVILAIGLILIFTAAAYACTISNNTFIINTYGRYSASGLTAISILKCFTGFAFPLFSSHLWGDYQQLVYDVLDYGWTNSMLGFIALGIGLPAVLLL